MTERLDLKRLERKAYTSYHQDGIVDIYLGLAIITFAITLMPMLINMAFLLVGGLSVVWILSYAGSKQTITVPRVGYVEFKKHRRSRIVFLALFLFILNLVLFAIFSSDLLRTQLNALINQYGLYLVAVVVGGLFALSGWVTQISRFYGYGGVTFLAFVVAQVFLLQLFLPVMALGIAITATGFVLLYRFLVKYPKPEPGVHWDDGRARDHDVIVDE